MITPRHKTIVHAICHYANHTPEAIAFNYLDNTGAIEYSQTYSELFAEARRWAALIDSYTEDADRVVLTFRPGPEFGAAFLGTLLAGRVAVPTAPPTRRGKDRFLRVVNNAMPSLILCSDALSKTLTAICENMVPLQTSAMLDVPATSLELPQPDQLAFLQYTSGSTSSPKGVMVSHHNIAMNETYIEECFGHNDASLILGWLPVYHDMGLIGTFMQPLWLGTPGFLMNPLDFVREPMSWLHAIDTHRISTSGGPNFAYDLCVNSFSHNTKLDLSSWLVAFNGAEPVKSFTMDRFAKTFAGSGFKQSSFLPCYGLAEATLFVTGQPHEQELKNIPHVDTGSVATDSGERKGTLVGLGKALPGTAVSLVSKDNQVCSDGVEGEIWVRGPSVTLGYWNNQKKTSCCFNQKLDGTADWLRTGDLGRWLDGQLCVTGRIKDLIIINGKNIYPQDLEAAAEEYVNDVNVAGAAAFARDGASLPEIVVELSRNAEADPISVANEVMQMISRHEDVAMENVYVVSSGSLPKTTSGKVQRRLTRRLIESGSMKVMSTWPDRAAVSANTALPSGKSEYPSLNPDKTSHISADIVDMVNHRTGFTATKIDLDAPIANLGISSLALVEMSHAIGCKYNISLDYEAVSNFTLSILAEHISRSATTRQYAEDENSSTRSLPSTGTEVPLSMQQQRFLILDELGSGFENQVVTLTVKLDADTDVKLLQRAVNAAASRHLSFLLRFSNDSTSTVAKVGSLVQIPLSVLKRESSLPQAIAQWRTKAIQPFDRQAGPLIRTGFVQYSEKKALLGISADHIISDGWSMRVFVNEVFSFYEAGLLFREPSIPNATMRTTAIGKILEPDEDLIRKSRDLWKGTLEGFDKNIDIPGEQEAMLPSEGLSFSMESPVSAELRSDIKRMAMDCATSPTVLWLTAFAILLSRISGSMDLVLGTPVADRYNEEDARTVGLLLDVLPVRIRLDVDSSFQAIAKGVRESLDKTVAGRALSLDQIMEHIPYTRTPERPPLFQILFNHLPDSSFAIRGDSNLLWEVDPLLDTGSKFDITLYVVEGLRSKLLFVYNGNIFSDSQMSTVAKQLITTVKTMLDSPDRCWLDHPLDENLPNDAQLERAPWSVSIHQRFVQHANSSASSKPALLLPDGITYSYRELHLVTNTIATMILEAGVSKGDRVAIVAQRDEFLPVAILSTLKAGAGYSVFNSEYPHARLLNQLDTLAPQLLIDCNTEGALIHDLISTSNLQVVHLNDAILQDAMRSPTDFQMLACDANDAACYTFTSGSSGNSQLVVGSHGSLVAFIPWLSEEFKLDTTDIHSMLSGLSHDPLQRDLFHAWWTGASVCVPPHNALSEPGIAWQWMCENGVTIANLTPSSAHFLLAGQIGQCNTLRHLFLVGESTDANILRMATESFPNSLFTSLYGATEAQRVFLYKKCYGITSGQIDLGYAAPYSAVELVNERGQPTAVGELGEIVLKSHALATGYFDAKEIAPLTRFLREDVVGNPCYYTGDLARRYSDGRLMFAGRNDRQIKRNGVRIDLNEIEKIGVSIGLAKPLAHWYADKSSLVLYALEAGQLTDTGNIRLALERELPSNMIPSQIHVLQTYPITANGKVDFAALSDAPSGKVVSPQGEEQLRMAQLWRKVLGLATVDADRSFIEQGGDSLKAIRLRNEIETVFGAIVPLTALLATDTFANICSQLGAFQDSSAHTNNVLEPLGNSTGPFPLNDIQRAYWIGRSGAMSMSVGSQSYYEFDITGIDLGKFEKAWNETIRRHDMLRATVDSTGMQHVQGSVPFYPIEHTSPPTDSLDEIRQNLRRVMSSTTFDCSTWPLFSVKATSGPTSQVLHVAFDFLLADAWSFGIIASELNCLYADLATVLPIPNVSFRDYVIMQQKLRNGPSWSRARTFWQEHILMMGNPPRIPLLEDPESVAKPSFKRQSFALPLGARNSLKEQAHKMGVTENALILTCFSEVVAFWADDSHFTINMTIFDRKPLHADVNRIVGDFTSVLLIDQNMSDDTPLRARCRQTQMSINNALEFRDYSGVEVMRDLNAQMSEGRLITMPIVMTSKLGINRHDEVTNDILDKRLYGVSSTPQVWLDAQVADAADGGLDVNWDFVQELLSDDLILSMQSNFHRLLSSIAESPNSVEKPACIQLPDRHAEIISKANQTKRPLYSGPLSLPALAAATEYPRQLAVAAGDGARLTHSELHSIACSYADIIRPLISEDMPVPIMIGKGLVQLIAVFAVLDCRCSYVPLDPEQGEQRIQQILSSLGTSVALVADENSANLCSSTNVSPILVSTQLANKNTDRVTVDTAIRNALKRAKTTNPDSAGYIIFTSGSTGTPKGVISGHRGASNTCSDLNKRYAINSQDCVFSISELTFDLSVYDIFGVLGAGGSIVLPAPDLRKDPEHWLRLLQQHEVTIWNSVPPLMSMLMDYCEARGLTLPPSLRLVFLSGDWIPPDLPSRINKLAPNAKIVSMGGATEASIWSILYEVNPAHTYHPSVPYGRAMANQTFYVYDNRMRDCPFGVTGELYIGGEGVSLGYFNDASQTSERFFIHPISGERLYRTGDIGCWMEGWEHSISGQNRPPGESTGLSH